ncbi:MAG: hydrolase [Isosphaeraceae bacterium]|jgi:hypothetical protein|nr:MAG: hydrolase [Isosphaeraceae bacterium]
MSTCWSWASRFAPAALLACVTAAYSADDDGPWIRVNQVGYRTNDPKIAILSSATPLSGEFSVGELHAPIGEDQGAWGPFAHNYRLDFTALATPGRYRVRFGATESPEFAIGDDLYRLEVVPALLDFLKLQRCGFNPVTGQPCHQQDGIDTVTGERMDGVGGWHDAADRLKHMITTTYCAAALMLCEDPNARQEGFYGADLVRKLHPRPDVIYIQIGDDRDHRPPHTLWHDDQSDYGHGKGGPRSAWPATGAPMGPKYQNESTGVSSIAGRAAAVMAIAGDLLTARSMYRLAKQRIGYAQSIPVLAPYYYMEKTYWDDLEWAAVELYRATREPQFLEEAIRWADQAGDNVWMGQDRHGHYEFFPYVNLAHWRLYPLVDQAVQARLAGYYRAGLERLEARALTNAYRFATPLVWCSTNDVIALATQARLYEQMTGDPRFRTLATEARDWIFGRNPWGYSFVCGVPDQGRSPSRPHHLFWKLAGRLPRGGLVDGPQAPDINKALQYQTFGADDLARFQSDVAVYHDMFEDFGTNEPILDGTVSLLFLIEHW